MQYNFYFSTWCKMFPTVQGWIFLAFLLPFACGKCLLREPPDVLSPPQQTDAGFYLTISGSPEFYEAGNLYTVSLQGDKTQFLQMQFTEFLLVVENTQTEFSSSSLPNANLAGRTGSFQLLGDVLTRFSDHCTNTVTQTSAVAKSEIQVLWTAPPAGSGCVTFKATIVENPQVWAMDTGRLSLQLCEAKVAEHSKPDVVTEPCCACEEAKYEVTFEGLWSDASHPKDFPSSRWLLHFSDIIGASHSADYRVWEYGGYASKGLSQVAKWGSPRVLESELKAESNHIRTIIKARGLWYPNVNGKTFAVFRTDRKNHLVSLVSMLGPSPDWIVGVSGLELCQKNCSWVETKELFLYPWDAGVDNGVSYESPDEPTEPQQPITRITSRHPDDPRQPFWNDTGAPMKPLAKLTVSRQRLYKKSCGDEDIPFNEADFYDEHRESVFEDHSLPGCDATPWSDWSDCSVTCGKGISMRTRAFVTPDKAAMLGCDRQMVQKEMCSATVPLCEGSGFYDSAPEDFLPDDMCATNEWSQWSQCSTTCGKGFESRTRRFYNRMGRKKCPHVETMEKRMCAGKVAVCPENDTVENPDCAVTSWSDWSPCSVSCGKGLKVRTRLYIVSPQQQTSAECNVLLMEKADCEGPRPECEFDADDARYICGLSKETGPCRGYFPRWYYDYRKQMCLQFIFGGCRGNSNNFERYDDCMKLCEMRSHQLQLDFGAATSTEEIGRGQTYSALSSPQQSQQHEEDDPVLSSMDMVKQKLMMEEKRKQMEQEEYHEEEELEVEEEHHHYSHLESLDHVPVVGETREAKRRRMIEEERKRQMQNMWAGQAAAARGEPATIVPPVDCLATAWSPWSDCSATCGKGFRKKFRMIKRHHTEGGRKCPRKLERRQRCKLPLCQQDCVLGEWGLWQACSQSCGSDGVQERQRQVDHAARKGGRPCGPRIERRICLLEPCP